MKKLLPLLALLALPARALELRFIGPCSPDFVMRTEVTEAYRNVGELTVATLAKFDIPFEGSEEGLASVFGTPTGKDALEIVSDVELRAYGWCYSVDGVAPEVYPHEVPVTAETKAVVWHYGFARYYKGAWVTQCAPAHTVRPAALCEGTGAPAESLDRR
jgi:hypothetical protein